ncbi:hypothetical protein EIN_519050 [Entamoeba invadens IP1]|uniref:Leucine rich repeat containing protein BspA family protein n=1 Tax=Entamoeba invadens IP1 TaxID=370355 RepID=A0A0A1UFK0_ENTIV|nr:hypothetical protein EIN_519050 [Entamoeba invadens IP1]ELP91708.1 hypothetical protein EIN_519050 [Entamoeba invadens IP1]|eukprot:XP_004258479.1 hypothetical protein EIN_519050 [Entamoeba invadens IP1]
MHNILSFGTQCFYKNTSLQEIHLDKRLTVLPFKCFYCCRNLKEIDLYYVTNIGEKCFEECSNLSSITLAKSLNCIGSNAFFHCYNIKNVTTNGLKKLNTLINFSTFEAFKKLDPTISLSSYDVSHWKNSLNALFEYPISHIESKAFFNKGIINEGSIPNTLTSIDWNNLDCIKIPNMDLRNVSVVGEFNNYNYAVTAITISSQIQFRDLYKLQNLNKIDVINRSETKKSYKTAACFMREMLMSQNLENVDYIFTGKDVEIFNGKVPSFCNQIDRYAFIDRQITNIEIHEKVFTDFEITNCQKLEKVVILCSWYNNNSSNIDNCDQLKEIVFLSKKNLFVKKCQNLTKVTLLKIPKWSNYKNTNFVQCEKLKEIVIQNEPENGVHKKVVSEQIYDFLKDKYKFEKGFVKTID